MAQQKWSGEKSAAVTPVLSVILTVFVSACSGGGGSSPSGSTAPVTPSPPPAQPAETSPPYTSFSTQPSDPANFTQLRANWETDEYRNQPALEMIKASSAYARGATGSGVAVGVFDTGIYAEHYEFGLGLDAAKVQLLGSDYEFLSVARTRDRINHGTLVSGVIAAQRQDRADGQFDMHGVAFDAELRVWEVPLGSGGGPYDPVDASDFNVADDLFFSFRLNELARVSDIVNMSFGFSGIISDYSAPSLAAALPNTLDALAQDSIAPGLRTVFVASAGNAHNDTYADGSPVDASSVELLAGLPWLFPELSNQMLAVVAVSQDGAITSYSNRCGVAASFCLAAPGGSGGNDRVYGPLAPPADAEPDTYYYGASAGTSFAAPLVSGSLALLKSMFPTVGNDELVNRLLQTANRTGIYADSSIYGQGLLDLDAATAPVGALALAMGDSVDDGFTPLDSNQLSATPAAIGDTLTSALGNLTFTAFDELGFPFEVAGERLISSSVSDGTESDREHAAYRDDRGTEMRAGWRAASLSPRDPGYAARERQILAAQYVQWRTSGADYDSLFSVNGNPAWQFGAYRQDVVRPDFGGRESLFGAPWLELVDRGLSSGVGSPSWQIALFGGDARSSSGKSSRPLQGALLEFITAETDHVNASWQFGYLDEQSAVLGIRGDGLLRGPDSTRTLFTGFTLASALGDSWELLLTGYLGESRSTNAGQALLSVQTALTSSAFSIGVARRNSLLDGDSFEFYLHQPLTIESGELQITLPEGRSVDGSVQFRAQPIDLATSNRPLETGLRYAGPLGSGELSASLNWSNQSNRPDAAEESLLRVEFRSPIEW